MFIDTRGQDAHSVWSKLLREAGRHLELLTEFRVTEFECPHFRVLYGLSTQN